jgi:ABC-type branched-subunit amino acid transport system substrate-binding protein
MTRKNHTPSQTATGILILLTALFVSLSRAGAGETGVGPDTILLGQSCALTGPAAGLGTGMKSGLEAAFDEINARGGIKGRQVILLSRDDYYEPGQASSNTESFVREGVFMLAGYVGTPTSESALPIAAARRIPFFAPLSGARFLRDPFRPEVVNLRAGYDEEMMHLISHLVKVRGITNIACFHQDDSFGQAGLYGARLAMTAHGLKLSATGSFQRNTVSVLAGLNAIRLARPEAVVLVAPHQPCSEFIKLAVARGMEKTVFCTLSFSEVQALNQALGPMRQDILVSQVTPFPWDESLPVVRDYLATLRAWRPRALVGYSSLEGYLAGRLFCGVAERVEGELTRAGFLAALENAGALDLGGLSLVFGPGDHQGMDRTYLVLVRNGDIRPLPQAAGEP